MMNAAPAARGSAVERVLALAAAPAVVVFVASNFVNVGNLAFNMIFSRLMGPELFGVLALMLTIKLALLGVMGAVQTAVSQKIAGTVGDEALRTEQALSRINRFLLSGLMSFGLLLATGVLLAEAVGVRLGVPHPTLLLILMLAVPFGASFSVLRGAAFGRMNSKRIAISANVEMAVRLIGGLLFWHAGFGIAGVVASLTLSIIAGWAVLADLLPRQTERSGQTSAVARSLFAASLPFGILQLAQTLALDGDIFLAQVLLPAHEAGQIAALSLFQRVQFFACFALASILLPGVVIAARDGTGLLASTLPVGLLFATVSLGLLTAATIAPTTLVTLLVGPSYAEAAPALLSAVGAAVAFTLSYLAATFLAALGDRRGIALVFAGACVQLALMGVSGSATLLDLVEIKLACQITTAGLVVLLAIHALRRGGPAKHLNQ